ncbi:hypothetical protein FF1_012304 [Malus domestica]
MDISLLYDTVTVTTTAQGLGFAKFLIRRHDLTSNNQISITDTHPDQPSPSNGVPQISAVIFSFDAVAPPRARPNSTRTATRTLLRKKRRTRRRPSSGDDSNDGGEEDGGFFGGDGPFFNGGWGGSGGGGGGGWNFDRFGGNSWDEPSSSSPSDPAFDFVYEVMCWIALSNCVHFAFKRVIRILADGLGDAHREKVPMRLTSGKKLMFRALDPYPEAEIEQVAVLMVNLGPVLVMLLSRFLFLGKKLVS